MKLNGGDLGLRRYSGGISFQNTSPVENYEDNLMLTWNPGCIQPTLQWQGGAFYLTR
jgi:hypothetical protein